jgi:hypothetical protein
MSAIGWQGRLNEAPTADDVVKVCNDFLASFTPDAIAELPASCRAQEPVRIGDINPYALRLIRQHGIGARASAPVLHDVSTFFTKAALRLAQITTQSAVVASEERSKSSD